VCAPGTFSDEVDDVGPWNGPGDMRLRRAEVSSCRGTTTKKASQLVIGRLGGDEGGGPRKSGKEWDIRSASEKSMQTNEKRVTMSGSPSPHVSAPPPEPLLSARRQPQRPAPSPARTPAAQPAVQPAVIVSRPSSVARTSSVRSRAGRLRTGLARLRADVARERPTTHGACASGQTHAVFERHAACRTRPT
jgi:hypothetical protein